MKKLKWYWKLLIFLLILFIVGLFSEHGFIINTYAESNSYSRDISFVNNDNELQYPIFDNKFNIYSNISSNGVLNYCDTAGCNGTYLPNPIFYYNEIRLNDGLVRGSGNTSSYTKINENIVLSNSTTGVGRFYRKFYISFNQTPYVFSLTKDKTYSILIELKRGNNVVFHNGNSYSKNDFIVDLGLYNNGQIANSIDKVDIQNIEFITDGLGNDDSKTAYIKLVFSLNDLLTENSVYLNYLDISLDNGNVSTNDYLDINTFKSFLIKTDTTDSIVMVNKIFLSEDLIPILGGIDYSSNTPIYEQCDNLDISCHVRNIFTFVKTSINNFLHNFQSFIYNIFVPNFNNLKVIFNNFYEVLTNKLGIVAYPLELFVDIVERFLSLTPTTIDNININIPEIRDPFYNQIIIQSGTWNLGGIIHTGNLYQLYLIYKIFITAYIIYLFVNFCYDAFSSFINGDGGHVSVYTAAMLHETEDTGETYDSYIRSHKI